VVIGIILSLGSSQPELLQKPTDSILDASEDSLRWAGRAVAEVVRMLLGRSSQLVGGTTLIVGDAITVEVGLQFAVGPGVEGGVFGSLGCGREVRCHGGVFGPTGLGGGGVSSLGLFNELITIGTGLLGSFLVLSLEPFPGVVLVRKIKVTL
jgi:hypothetical protein